MPKLTVNIANSGTSLAGGGTSAVGHMWYSLNDGQGGPDYSYGFAPDEDHHGSPFAPGKVYATDNEDYQSRYYSRTIEISQAQYDAMKEFGDTAVSADTDSTISVGGVNFTLHYNGLANSCIDFTWAALQVGGLNPSGYEGAVWPTWNKSALDKALDEYGAKQGASSAGGTSSYDDGQGNVVTVIKDKDGNIVSDSWKGSDGSQGKDIYNKDGSSSGTATNADGTSSSYAVDAHGNGIENNFSGDGTKIGDNWVHTNGDYGADTYNADGSSSGTAVNVNGTSSAYQDNGHGDRTTTNYDANGDVTSVKDVVTRTDDQGNSTTGTTTTNYDPATGAETGHSVSTNDDHDNTTTTTYDANGNLTSYSWQTEGGGSGTNTYGANGALTSETWRDGEGNSGTNTYGANGALASSSWQAADGRSGTNNYDQSGNLVSDSWKSAGGTSGTDTYREDGSRASDTWQSPAGSSGSDSYGTDGSTISTTVTPGADGSTTKTAVIVYPPEDGYGGDYGGTYGGDYGPAYGQYNGYRVTQTTTTNADGSSTDTITTNENGYNDTTTTITSADGSYTRNESDGLGNHSSYSYNVQTGEYDSSTYNADGSHTDTSGVAGGDYNSTSYDANGNVTGTKTEVRTATSDTVTTRNSDGSTTVDVRAPSSNGGSWDETVTTTNGDGSHSETRITNDRHDRVTDNYDADGNIVSETGHYDSIPSSDWVGGVISSDWETTYHADGSSTRVEKESGGGEMITHVTETDSYDHTVSTSTIMDRYDHTRDETTQNADGSHSTAHWDSDGDYASHAYNSDGIDVHDASRSADGSTYDRTYDTDAGVATETSYDASTGGHTRYDHYYDTNGVEYKETGAVTDSDGNTVSMESLNTPEGWLTITTGPDGTAEYSFGAEGGGDSITADQYDQYWTDYFGSDAASNDPGAGDSGTGDPAAGDGSTPTTDMAVGTPEQHAA